MIEIQEIAETLSRLLSPSRDPGRLPGPPLVLSLEDVIEEAPVDDAGVVRARVEYHYSKLLIPRSLRRGQAGLRKVVHIGVDSSSRIIAAPHAVIVVGSVAVAAGSLVNSFAWPSLHGGELGGGEGPPFIALVPYLGQGRGRASRFVLVYSGDGAGQALHGLKRVSRELRVVMENWVLENLEAILESLGGHALARGRPVVMLDGPLFMASALDEEGREQAEGRSWRELMESRTRAIESLESRGIPVVGVVKRVEGSTILSKAREFAEKAERCIGSPGPLADMALLHMILRSGCSPANGSMLFTPKISVEYGVDWLPGKIVEYAIIAPSAWHTSSPRAKILRLEATRRTLELLAGMGTDPETILAGDTLSRGSLEPASILASDRLARAVSSAVKRSLVASLLREDVPLTYDESRRVERLWRAG
jgi:hypothetical protein